MGKVREIIEKKLKEGADDVVVAIDRDSLSDGSEVFGVSLFDPVERQQVLIDCASESDALKLYTALDKLGINVKKS